MRLSEEYFTKLDPDFLIAVGKLYLQCGPTEAPKAGDAASPVLVKCAVCFLCFRFFPFLYLSLLGDAGDWGE